MTRWTLFFAAILLCVPVITGAQPTPGPSVTGVAHIALRVSDLDAEVSFFNKLGYEKSFTDVDRGKTLQVLIKINDRTFIQLYPSDGKQPLGFMHVAYETQDAKGLNARYVAAALKPSAVHQDGAGDVWFNMPDPDGRTTEFMQYLPNSKQAADVGQHLTDQYVSNELMGFEMPVKEVAASENFYSALGFNTDADGSNVRLSLPSNPDVRIVLHPTRPGSQPQLLFPVDDAQKVAEWLTKKGLTVDVQNKLLFLNDKDGNSFVLLETAEHNKKSLIPWKK